MDKPQTFNHSMFGELTVLVVDGTEWFGATEAAKALSFSDPHKAIKNHVDEEDSTVHPVLTEGGRQNKKFINESGLYSLILGAARQGNNPEIREKAKAFKRWVTSEVLPSIRKTGSYSVQQPKTQAELLLMYAEHFVEMERKQKELEQKVDLLTSSLTSVPDHKKVVERVNEYARWARMGHNEVYNKIYDILQARHGIDVRKRVENERQRVNEEYFKKTGKYYKESTLKNKVNGIDVMVRLGILDKFNEILVGLLAEVKGVDSNSNSMV